MTAGGPGGPRWRGGLVQHRLVPARLAVEVARPGGRDLAVVARQGPAGGGPRTARAAPACKPNSWR